MPENKKEKAKCVEVNIFVKCDDDSKDKEKEKEKCVEVNIHVECDDCEKKKRHYSLDN